MAKASKRRYAINFDLSIQQLEQYYSEEHPKRAYAVIKKYMLSHGFEHRQYSGYVSIQTLSKPELLKFTMELHNAFPWLINCEGSMDATVITDIFDIKQMIVDTMTEDEDMDISL